MSLAHEDSTTYMRGDVMVIPLDRETAKLHMLRAAENGLVSILDDMVLIHPTWLIGMSSRLYRIACIHGQVGVLIWLKPRMLRVVYDAIAEGFKLACQNNHFAAAVYLFREYPDVVQRSFEATLIGLSALGHSAMFEWVLAQTRGLDFEFIEGLFSRAIAFEHGVIAKFLYAEYPGRLVNTAAHRFRLACLENDMPAALYLREFEGVSEHCARELENPRIYSMTGYEYIFCSSVIKGHFRMAHWILQISVVHIDICNNLAWRMAFERGDPDALVWIEVNGGEAPPGL